MTGLLWVDKYRPDSLEQMNYHKDLSDSLVQLSKADLPHMLIYGPSGAGRKTRAAALLKNVYGPVASRLKIETKEFLTASQKKIELIVVSSPVHIEITPSEVGNNDRIVVMDLIKQMAQTKQIDSSLKHQFKVIVIHDAHTLSRDAQAGLRRTMEKYSANLRLVLICESLSRVIGPIQSRCLLVRVPAPKSEEIVKVLSEIAIRENLPEAGKLLLVKIAESSKGNLRRAILTFEAVTSQGFDVVPKPEIEQDVESIGDMVLQEQVNINDKTPDMILKIRTKLYKVMASGLPGTEIIRILLSHLSNHSLFREFLIIGGEYQHRLCLGTKEIFHLEAFIAKLMLTIVSGNSS